MIELNKRYIVTHPSGEKEVIYLQSTDELNTYTALAETGSIFNEVKVTVIQDSSCINCEG